VPYCKIQKYQKKGLYKDFRWYVGPLLKELVIQKECRLEEWHLMADYIHTLIYIPPKYSVARVVGFIKGKSAISVAGNHLKRKRNFTGQKFWVRAYHVSIVGRD
jgi:putative transposase